MVLQMAGCRDRRLGAAVDEMESLRNRSVEGMPGKKLMPMRMPFDPLGLQQDFVETGKSRAKGVGIGVTGIATSPFVESERLQKFPEVERQSTASGELLKNLALRVRMHVRLLRTF
jgi:hypothetical protein